MINRLRDEINLCRKCDLWRTRTQVVLGAGNIVNKCMLIGEAPGEEEDLFGYPFVGKAGRLLTEALIEQSLLRRDLYITNVVHCRPTLDDGRNRTPTLKEIRACREWLLREIDLIRPRLILLMGSTAVKGTLGNYQSVSSLRGRIISWQDFLVIVTYHPAAIIYNPSLKGEFEEDLRYFSYLVQQSKVG